MTDKRPLCYQWDDDTGVTNGAWWWAYSVPMSNNCETCIVVYEARMEMPRRLKGRFVGCP
jgi:hypothetical protein